MKIWKYCETAAPELMLSVLLTLALPLGAMAKPAPDAAGNNLSFPVIWADGVEKTLPGTPGMTPVLDGEWWYWWGTSGTDPDIIPLSCAPDPDDNALCNDGIPGQATGVAPGAGAVRAYLQKDPYNTWQAESAAAVNDVPQDPEFEVHWIDWGDNLESVDWYTRSQVRTEVVLFQDLVQPMLEYEMRHVSGWGIDEVHGLAAQGQEPILGAGNQATVYTHCARLTIQKLLLERDDPSLADLLWEPGQGWYDLSDELINPPIFNKTVAEAGDGPGYYSAEINVKGRIIFGYTWNVRKLNDQTMVPPYTKATAAGDYRITFSLDDECGTVLRNTYFGPSTQILLPTEEELDAAAYIAALSDPFVAIQSVATESEETDGGAVAVLDLYNGVTYMDVRILERSGGGSGGGGNGGGGGKGHNK